MRNSVCGIRSAEEKRCLHSAFRAPHSALTNSLRPVACEDLCGGAGHVNAIVRFAPFEVQVAAAEVVDNSPLSSSGKHAGYADRAGPGATGQRFAAAALPRSLTDLAGRKNLDEFDVDPGRKHRR